MAPFTEPKASYSHFPKSNADVLTATSLSLALPYSPTVVELVFVWYTGQTLPRLVENHTSFSSF